MKTGKQPAGESRNQPGARCLAGMLERLMIAVQHEHNGSEQLVHPLHGQGHTEV